MHQRITGYFGENLGLVELEAIGLKRLTKAQRLAEAACYSSAWFDYRVHHYVKRTYLFAHVYTQWYQWFVHSTTDFKRAPFVKGFKGTDIADTRQFSGFVKLRQHIDGLGYRYDWFLPWAMAWFVQRLWQRPPMPSQMVGEEELWFDAALAWMDARKIELQVATEPFYLATNWADHPDQIEYEAHLIRRIKERAMPHFALANVVWGLRHLRGQTVVREFDRVLLAKAAVYFRNQVSAVDSFKVSQE